MLDGDKVFFTQADMDKFAPLKSKFDDAIWNSDLSAPFAIFNLYLQRAVQRMSYARELLKNGFDLSRDESYEVDRKDAAWPKDEAAAQDLWRKRTKNDWLRLKLAGKDDADIRKTLDKRYSGYIDRIRQINSADAFQTFMNAYAESTDPHTDYLGPEAAANFDIAMSLSLQGIGAQLQSRDDYTMIVKLIPGGPAMKSHKFKPGDRIVAVGQGDKGAMVDVVGWRIDDVTALIRGKKGTVVRLEVLPADVGPDGKHELITLVRDKINLEDAAASKKVIEIKDGAVTRKIGVIDLPSFYSDFGARSAGDKDYRSTTRDVAKLIAELKQEGVQGIVVDLRNNGGGSLAEADSMTGLFIDKGPVVQVRGSHGEVQVQGDDDAGMAWSGPLAVLVNRGTASASEIFSAAIQDYHRGLVIGEPTFGKGTVQTLVDLDKFASGDSEKPQLGELKMTIQEFFRINGGSTHPGHRVPEERRREGLRRIDLRQRAAVDADSAGRLPAGGEPLRLPAAAAQAARPACGAIAGVEADAGRAGAVQEDARHDHDLAEPGHPRSRTQAAGAGAGRLPRAARRHRRQRRGPAGGGQHAGRRPQPQRAQHQERAEGREGRQERQGPAAPGDRAHPVRRDRHDQGRPETGQRSAALRRQVLAARTGQRNHPRAVREQPGALSIPLRTTTRRHCLSSCVREPAARRRLSRGPSPTRRSRSVRATVAARATPVRNARGSRASGPPPCDRRRG